MLGWATSTVLAQEDPGKIVGAERCGNCHRAELAVLKSTPHASGFRELHRETAATEVARRMGFRLIKRDSLCLQCHYTASAVRGQLRAISGVSCESCHGAGRDWIDIHNDYGSGNDFESESAEHRQQRIEQSIAAGMRRPSMLYGVVSSCYECHTVQNEKLVNEGGHNAGSGRFELVEWSQGTIRHHFLDSFRSGDVSVNAEHSAEHRRVLYVVGRALELEYSLRGAAQARENGIFVKSMIRRSRAAVGELREIVSRVPELEEIGEMLSEVRGVKLGPNNGEPLRRAASRVGRATKRLISNHDGRRLAALDPLMSGEEELADVDVQPSTEAETSPQSRPTVQTADVGVAPGTERPAAAAPEAPAAAAAQQASVGAGTQQAATPLPARPVGEIKRRIRPRSGHPTLGGGNCTGCHEEANAWWFDDAHFSSADPFFEENPANARIARLYGIRPAEMTRGNRVCMDCHGTIATGRESREVNDGVSCESCHGAAGDYLKPHREGDKALGAARPGYVAALRLGLTELQDLPTRAATCSGCHLITDLRLISSGHPTGEDFDYVDGMEKVRHWEEALAPSPELRSVFASVLASRGPIPRPPSLVASSAAAASTASTPATPTSLAGAVSSLTANGSLTATVTAPKPRLPRTLAPRPSAVAIVAATPASLTGQPRRPLDLSPLPAVDESYTVEEVLLLLKQRLEELYRQVYGKIDD